MMGMKQGDTRLNERRYYEVLQRIARHYHTSERLLKDGEKLYGVPGDEALVMAYDNIRSDAAEAIRGRRKPGGSK
jgi:hypothetical protein